MIFGAFEFTAVLPQLRRNEIKSESSIQARLFIHFWNFRRRLLLFDLRLWIGRQLRQAVFVQGPAALQCTTAHLDVEFFAAGKIIKRDRKSTRLNSSHSQISYAIFCL